LEHMVDSYEIYGEKQPDDSEVEEQEEIVHNRKRTSSNKQATASRKGRSYRNEQLDGIGEIMIENEHVIEPSKMNKPYGNKSRSASNNHGNRKSSNTRDRRDNSAKKT